MSAGRHIYGRHPVSEALRTQPAQVRKLYVADGAQGGRISDLVATAESRGVSVVTCARGTLERLVGKAPHQGVVAEVIAFAYQTPAQCLLTPGGRPPLVVACDQIQDPHNLGSMIRSAFALGASGLMIVKDRACEVTPTVVKTSAGATAHLPISRVTNLRRALEDLKEAGLWIVGTVVDGGKPLDEIDLCAPTALVLGCEEKGMRRSTTAACDHVAHIPMPGALGSLNASVALAICLYEATRQRRVLP